MPMSMESIIKASKKCAVCKEADALTYYNYAYMCPDCLKATLIKQKERILANKHKYEVAYNSGLLFYGKEFDTLDEAIAEAKQDKAKWHPTAKYMIFEYKMDKDGHWERIDRHDLD